LICRRRRQNKNSKDKYIEEDNKGVDALKERMELMRAARKNNKKNK
jgi:hypothetical protein